VIEVVDERGDPVPPGVTGDRVLLTVFDRRTLPLFRYEITGMIGLAGGHANADGRSGSSSGSRAG